MLKYRGCIPGEVSKFKDGTDFYQVWQKMDWLGLIKHQSPASNDDNSLVQ